MSGILGFIIGYDDVQRVDNFIDGVEQGIGMFKKAILEIPEY